MDSKIVYAQLAVLANQLDIIKPAHRNELMGTLGDLLTEGKVAVRNVQRTVEICSRLARKQLGDAGHDRWAERLYAHCLQELLPNLGRLLVLDGPPDVRWFSWANTYAHTFMHVRAPEPDARILTTFHEFLQLVSKRRLKGECTTNVIDKRATQRNGYESPHTADSYSKLALKIVGGVSVLTQLALFYYPECMPTVTDLSRLLKTVTDAECINITIMCLIDLYKR